MKDINALIDEAFKFIKPVMKVKNGTGIMGMDSARLMLKQAIALELRQARIEALTEVDKVGKEFDKNWEGSVAHNCVINRISEANLQQGNTHE